MDLVQCALGLRRGMAVRRRGWPPNTYIKLKVDYRNIRTDYFVDQSNMPYQLSMLDIEASDFVLVQIPMPITATIPQSGQVQWIPNPAIVGSHRVSIADMAKAAEPKCDCGKDKHGFTAHSGWCSKLTGSKP